MPALDPTESEFGSTAEAEAYEAWFRAKVELSLADTRPPIPHEQVMVEMKALIESSRK